MKIFKIDIPRVLEKIIEIVTLASPLIIPFILALFGIDVGSGLSTFKEILLMLGALIVAVKDLIQIVKGWFDTGKPNFLVYIGMTSEQFHNAVYEEQQS